MRRELAVQRQTQPLDRAGSGRGGGSGWVCRNGGARTEWGGSGLEWGGSGLEWGGWGWLCWGWGWGGGGGGWSGPEQGTQRVQRGSGVRGQRRPRCSMLER